MFCQLVVDLNSTIDVDYSDELASARPHDCVPVAATDPIYMLHTSGTTGEPKVLIFNLLHVHMFRTGM